jgi:photosystem I P700 chlorophyll a apoprotein A1
VGGFKQGLVISSGLFNLWASQGFTSYTQLKLSSFVSLSLSFLVLYCSYFHMHVSSQIGSSGVFKKFKTVLPHHISLLAGLGSISWSAHLIHISIPVENLLHSGVDPICEDTCI